MKKNQPMLPAGLSRRRLLLQALFGTGLVGLRSLATGIPRAVLENPHAALRAFDAGNVAAARPAQYLIFNSLGSGDPLNANVPGMFGQSPLGMNLMDISHSTDPSMAATQLTLNGTPATAALPWAQLKQWVLDRTCFFHHGTYTVVHPDMNKVMTLESAVLHQEMLVSLIAANVAPALGTVQQEPISLAPRVSFKSRPQPVFPPVALASLLASPTGMLGQLRSLRDSTVDQLNALARSEGTLSQQGFIDRYVLSQREARQLSDSLLSQLQGIKDNGPNSQMAAAVTLIQMNISPVIGVSIPFGGDNHTDTLLMNETAQTVSGVATIGGLMDKLDTAGLKDKVTFMSLNVFGRTLVNSDNGRNHHGDHHCMVLIGKPFLGSVVGGVEAANHDYRATSIDSQTGNAVAAGGGDVPFSQTLAAAGKTLSTGVGLDPAVVNANITGGKVIGGALAPA